MPDQGEPQVDEPAVFCFGRWTLHPRTGVLSRPDGPPATLRPKTAAVLARLLATPGVLVSRESLLDEIWPGVVVTDDSVTQCIAEIRRALGEDGKLLRTAPRRGYVLDVPAALPLTMAPPAAPEPSPTGAGRRRWRMAVAAGLSALAAAGMFLAVLAGSQRTDRSASDRLVAEGRRVFYRPGDARNAWPAARALFLRAHDADPTNPDTDSWAAFTYTNMVVAGYTADATADLAEAERLADRAVSLGPSSGLAWAARAGVYRSQRRYEDALATYRRAVQLDPTQLPSQANAGWMLVLLGRPEQAVGPIRSVLAATAPSHPFRSIWFCYLGVAQFAAGQGDRGADAFRSTGGKSDGCARADELAFLLVAALALDGDLADARPLLETTRLQWPGVTEAVLRGAAASADPGYLAQREQLFQGLALAGFNHGASVP